MGKKIVFGGVGTLAAVGIMSAVVGGGGDAEAEAGGKKDSSSSSTSSAGKKSDDSPRTTSTNKNNAPKDDIKIGEPTSDGYGSLKAPVTITNHTSKTSDYDIEVEFLDADGNRIETGYALETSVAPDQKVSTNADGFTDDAPSGTMTVKVLSVDRYASL
ncbi:FxLYD domain-containing protein [Streptomyces sp. NPDC102360]|uniref:FxLYD domain-containing protein n=1 Tax=Streptomyces sp. NPDC102360 TaxID=3366160 RepID=UPI0037F83C31